MTPNDLEWPRVTSNEISERQIDSFNNSDKNREIRPNIHDLATFHGSLAPHRGLGPGRDLYFRIPRP